MAYITLDEAKAHLRVDFDDDNDYITSLIDVVENIIAIEIGEDLVDLEELDEHGEPNGILPKRLIQGMLLLLAHFYLIREPIIIGTSVNKVPLGFEYLIAPFKNYTIG